MAYSGPADPSSLSRARDSLLLSPPGAYLEAFPGLEVRPAAGPKRRGLFATRPFPRGAPLLIEPAVLWEPPASPPLAPSLTPDEADALLYQLAPFYGAPDACASLPPLPRAELARRVLAANSFCVGSAAARFAQGGEGRALFPAIALVNHDCSPNARTFQEEGGEEGGGEPPRRVLEARRDISIGEEVTVSYVPTTWLKPARAARISAWGFVCNCARCATAHDDALVARCGSCAQGRLIDDARGCADCGAAPFEGAVRVPQGGGVTEALCAPGRQGSCCSGSLRIPCCAPRIHDCGAQWGTCCRC